MCSYHRCVHIILCVPQVMLNVFISCCVCQVMFISYCVCVCKSGDVHIVLCVSGDVHIVLCVSGDVHIVLCVCQVIFNTLWLLPVRLLLIVIPSLVVGSILFTLSMVGERFEEDNPQPQRSWRRSHDLWTMW